MRIACLVALVVCSLMSRVYGQADSAAVYPSSGGNLLIGDKMGILEDKTGALQVRDAVRSDQFKRQKLFTPNLGVSNSAFWLKIPIRNNSATDHLVLELAYPIMDEVEFYAPTDQEGKFSVIRTGDSYNYRERNYDHQNFIFDIQVPQGAEKTYYMKIKSGEQILAPVILGTPASISKANLTKDVLFGIYFGIVFAMFLYNLVIYFIVRDRSYLYYVVYVLFIFLTQVALQGYTFRFLWPNSPWFANHSITLFPAIAGIATIGFVRTFLQTKKVTPKLDIGLFVIVIIYCFALVTNFILNNQSVSYRIIDLDATLISLYTLIVAIVIARKGYRSAKFFLLGWSIFLFGVIGFVLKNFDVLPNNNLTDYTMSAGTVAEVLMFSVALADRINILRKEKEESQQKALETLLENERIVSQQNVILEARVKERTEELETSNQNLKDAQVQLVNAEKMASLGQLTAGIAHEINNPINFVISNVGPLKRDIGDLLQVLSRYSDIKDEKDLVNKLHEISELKKQLDTDYLVEEINLLLRGIDEGAVRTSEIVKGLQNFSRLDEDGLKTANIHTGIDATLLLLNSNLNSKHVQIIRQYGDFGDVECFPGKLNQVFMNILSNAIQAFEPDSTDRKITITTSKENKVVRISIKDNGPGMKEEVKRRIFEPFFTTKNVGEGSGLGLSIVYGIIEKHGGKITVESAPGKGSEFIITLPASF